MEPTITSKDAFTVMGVAVRGNPAALDYGDIWMNHFMAREPEIKPHSTDGAYYAAYFHTGEEGAVEMLCGMAVQGVQEAPAGLVVREVPAATYAPFECTVSTIGSSWPAVEKWLEGSEYEWDHSKADLEYYPPDTTGDESPVVIYVPVTPRA